MTRRPYTCYLIDDASRRKLEDVSGGYAFSERRGEHITLAYDASGPQGLRKPKSVRVYAFITDTHGMEAFLVEIDGKKKAPDGRAYHVTWSFDPRKDVPVIYEYYEDEARGFPDGFENTKSPKYSSRHANTMIHARFNGLGAFIRVTPLVPVEIAVEPAFVTTGPQGHRVVQKLGLN